MSLTFFRALDKLLRMASELHPVISAISSVSYSSTSIHPEDGLLQRWQCTDDMSHQAEFVFLFKQAFGGGDRTGSLYAVER